MLNPYLGRVSMVKSKIICKGCLTTITRYQVKKRLEKGFNFLRCPVCDLEIIISDDINVSGNKHPIAEVETKYIKYAELGDDGKRKAAHLWDEKVKKNEYDIFFIYNRDNIKSVDELKRIGRKLKIRGIRPWLDEWESSIGSSWQIKFEQDKRNIKSAVVFIGSKNNLPWDRPDLDQIIRYFIKYGYPIIPAILESCEDIPEKFPFYWHGISCIDFRSKNKDLDPIDSIIQSVQGRSYAINKRELCNDYEIIRRCAGDRNLNQFFEFAGAVSHLLGFKSFAPIDIGLQRGTLWEAILPSIGLKFKKGTSIILFRNKELRKEESEKIRDYCVSKRSDLLLIIDVSESYISPKKIYDRVIWIKIHSLMETLEIPENKIPGWLSRMILGQIDLGYLSDYLPYRTASDSGEDAPFYGRRSELRKLIGKNYTFPGGIITGAHKSGKTTLLHKIKDLAGTELTVSDDQEFEILGPISLNDSANTYQFFEKTLDNLGIEQGNITLDTWDTAIRRYSEKGICPVFLLDDVDPFIASDAKSGFLIGGHIRALHYEKKSRFYFSGHENLRKASELEGSPYRNLGPDFILKGLNPEDALNLILEPLKEIGFEIEEDQAERIIKGTAGVAVLIQDYCIRILTKIVERYKNNSELMDICSIDSKIDKSIFFEIENDPAFLGHVFKYYDFAQTWSSTAIMIMTSIKGKIMRNDFFRWFKSYQMSLERETIDIKIDFLIKFGILAENYDGSFQILPEFLNLAIKKRDPISLLDSKINVGLKEDNYDRSQ